MICWCWYVGYSYYYHCFLFIIIVFIVSGFWYGGFCIWVFGYILILCQALGCTHYQSKRPVLRSRCPAFRLASDPGFWSWLLIPLLGSFIFIGRSSFMEKFQWSCQNFSCIWLAIDDLIHPTGAQASVDALIGCGTALSRSKALVFRKFQYHALKNMDQRWIQEQKLEATKLARR